MCPGSFFVPLGDGGLQPSRLLRGGAAFSRRDAPPIFFLSCQKENAPRPVQKKKRRAGLGAGYGSPAGLGGRAAVSSRHRPR